MNESPFMGLLSFLLSALSPKSSAEVVGGRRGRSIFLILAYLDSLVFLLALAELHYQEEANRWDSVDAF